MNNRVDFWNFVRFNNVMGEKSNTAKSGKMGCGTLIVIIVVLVVLGGMGINQALGYYYKHCSDQDVFECLMNKVKEPEPEGAVTATGTYSFKDYSVVVIAHIPLKGGGVTGAITGTCEGALKGTFSGENNGAFSGKITGACSPFFVNIPASANFSGTVNKDSKTAPIGFTGRGAGLTHEGSMSLSY